MAQWNTLLKTLGFTDSEAKLYLLSLEVGPSSVQDLAKKAKVSRVTTYAAIEVLTQRGLMSNVQKGKKTLFASESPERLVSFVQSRMTQMQTTLKEVEGLIGDLQLLQRGEKPVVKMFEGKEGLIAINDDILKSHPEVIYEFANMDALNSVIQADDLVPMRKQFDAKKVKNEGIITFSKPLTPREHATFTQIHEKEFPFHGNIVIYGNKVALSSLQGKNISVLVESEIIAQTMKQLFRLAKHGAEKFKK